MIKFDMVDELLNLDKLREHSNPIYVDTDSLFLTLNCSLVDEREKALSQIDYIQNTINEVELNDFLNMHNSKVREEDNSLLIADYKNEYMIKSMALYSKKRYIAVIIKFKKDGTLYYDIDIKGVEGKRVTYPFVKEMVDELLEYLKELNSVDEIYTRKELLEHIVKKHIDNIYEIDINNIYNAIERFSLPVNVNKQIIDLKTVQGYYRGTLIFDIVSGMDFWKGKTGKGKWLSVQLIDESYIPKIMEAYINYPQIKTAQKQPSDLIKDLTIPDELLQKESDIITDLFKVFKLNYDHYVDTMLKKITLMYNPFDPVFCDNLLKKQKNDVPHNCLIIGEDMIYEKSLKREEELKKTTLK